MSDVVSLLRLGPRKGLRRAPSALALYARGCELEAHDPAAAAVAYQRATLARPGLADAHNNLGRLRHNAGALADAEAAYRRAIASDAAIGLYHYNLGVVLEDQGRVPEAVASYREALAREPALAEAHFNLAGLLERAGDVESLRHAVRHLALYRALRRAG
jgi:tetratricopeptide (TPR) repeat protein